MDKGKIFEKRVNAITAVLFFITMAILFFFEWLPIWAAAMAALFLSVTIRQFLIGRLIDVFVSLILFGLLFITNSFFYSEFWTGLLLLGGALYVFIRQCFELYTMQKYREDLAHVHEEKSSLEEDLKD